MNKLKTITSIGSIGLVAVIVWLFIRIEGYKDAKADQLREIAQFEWLISAKEAENDTLRIMGQYSKTDTVWRTQVRTRIDTISGKVDTVYEDIADISGSIKIDTTKELGSDSNPMSIRVAGQFWWPEEYAYRNWMIIHPVAGKPPQAVATRSRKSVGIGLNYSRSFGQEQGIDCFGGSVRYKRITLTSGYDPWRKSLISGISYEFLTF